MSSATMYLADINAMFDVIEPVDYRQIQRFVRNHATTAATWTKSGAKIAGRETLFAFVGVFVELADTHVQNVRLAKATTINNLRYETLAMTHKWELEAIRHAAHQYFTQKTRVLTSLESLRKEARAQEDMETYRWISKNLQEIHLMPATDWQHLVEATRQEKKREYAKLSAG